MLLTNNTILKTGLNSDNITFGNLKTPISRIECAHQYVMKKNVEKIITIHHSLVRAAADQQYMITIRMTMASDLCMSALLESQHKNSIYI